jgi:hypothetical protein
LPKDLVSAANRADSAEATITDLTGFGRVERALERDTDSRVVAGLRPSFVIEAAPDKLSECLGRDFSLFGVPIDWRSGLAQSVPQCVVFADQGCDDASSLPLSLLDRLDNNIM